MLPIRHHSLQHASCYALATEKDLLLVVGLHDDTSVLAIDMQDWLAQVNCNGFGQKGHLKPNIFSSAS